MSAVAGQRSVKLIIGETIQELKAREQLLLGALGEVRSFIRVLHEAAGVAHREEPIPPAETDGAPVKLVRRTNEPLTDRQREDALRAALADGPLSMGVLLDRTNLTVGLARPALLRLKDHGVVQMTGTKGTARWWLTEQLDRAAAENDGQVPAGDSGDES